MFTTFYDMYNIYRSKNLISRNVNPKTSVVKGVLRNVREYYWGGGGGGRGNL
jgi:hypothetical protein